MTTKTLEKATITVDVVKQYKPVDLLEQALMDSDVLSENFNKFHRYSTRNQMVLRRQGADEPMASFAGWKKEGRQVQKGAKALYVRRPVQVDDLDLPKVDGKYQKKTIFPFTKCSFRLSDTKMIDETADDKYINPTINADWKIIADNLKIEVKKFEMVDGNVQGYATGNSIAISELATNPAMIAYHEIAHVVLGHTKLTNSVPKGIRELQAEATAFIVAKTLGVKFNEEESQGYITHWQRHKNIDKVFINQILTAVDKMTKATLPKVEYKKKAKKK